MKWRVVITKEAEKDINRLTSVIRESILQKLEWFSKNFELVTPFPLGHDWKGFFKLRAGDWRIVYEVNNADYLIFIHYIGHRNKIYKQR